MEWKKIFVLLLVCENVLSKEVLSLKEKSEKNFAEFIIQMIGDENKNNPSSTHDVVLMNLQSKSSRNIFDKVVKNISAQNAVTLNPPPRSGGNFDQKFQVPSFAIIETNIVDPVSFKTDY